MPIKHVCSTCGSENVTRDGIAEWDFENQCWSLRCVLQNADCEDCGGETTLETVDVQTHEALMPDGTRCVWDDRLKTVGAKRVPRQEG